MSFFNLDVAGWIAILYGIFLVVVGVLKLRDLKGFKNIVKSYEILSENLLFLAYLLPFVEVAAGIWLITRYYLFYSALVSGLMIIMFLFFMGIAMARNKELDSCGCYGTAINDRLGFFTLLRDSVFLVLILYVLIAAL